MKLFFENIDTLDRFTNELDHHKGSLTCKHCLKQDQFVSHGFVYKNQHIDRSDERETVGKRIFCSNRYGRSGCGRTIRLYLANNIPKLNRTAIHIALFFLALISGKTIQPAYKEATHSVDPRNAYRWLSKCHSKMTYYRTFLANQCEVYTSHFKSRTHRLQLLLPTMKKMQYIFPDSFVADFQLKQQQHFM